MASTSLPTATQTRQVGEAKAVLAKAIDETNTAIAGMPAFYKLLSDNSVHPAGPKEIKPIK